MSNTHGPEHQPQAAPDNHPETNDNQRTEIPEDLDINNQPGFFERVRNNTREFVGSVKTTARIGTVERLQTWWNDNRYRKQDQKADQLSSEYESRNREIHALEERVRRQDVVEADMQLTFGVRAEHSKKFQKDRQTLINRIEQAKNEREIARLNLESVNYKKRVYEKKNKDIAHEVVARVNEHLQPLETRMAVMTARKQQLDSEISTFKTSIEQAEAMLAEVRKVHSQAEFDFDKDAYREELRDLELQLRDYNRNLDQRVKESERLEKSLELIAKKVVAWQGRRGQYEQVLARQSKYHQKDVDEEKMQDVRARLQGLTPEEREQLRNKGKIDPEKMLKLWNALFGSKLKISSKLFNSFVSPQQRQEGINHRTFRRIVEELTNQKISESDWDIFADEAIKLSEAKQIKPVEAPAQSVTGEHLEEEASDVVIEPAGEMPEPATPQGQSGETDVEDAIVVPEEASEEEGSTDRELEPIERKLRRFNYQGFGIRQLVAAWNERFSKEFALDPKAFEEDAESMFPDRKNKKLLTMRDFKNIVENQFAHLTSGAVGARKEEIEAFKESIEKFRAAFIENQIGKLDGYADPESAEFYDQETEIASLCDLWNDLSDDADDEVTPEKLKDFEPNVLAEGKTTLDTGTFLEAVGSYRKKTLPRYDKNKEKKTTGWFSRFLIRRWGLKKKK